MWEQLKIETTLSEALVKDFGNSKGKEIFSRYIVARSKLPDVWEEIKRREKDLTDHGPRHIADVLQQADELMPDGHLSSRELLALLLSVLFHDTGNIHGRDGHEKKISDIYNFVVGQDLQNRLEEKKIVLAIVGAHGGVARDGTKDTIKDLTVTEPYLKKTIRMQEVASILRFADELAEGQHRTSEYLLRNHDFSIDAEIYHEYASITNICIDPGNSRIALTYHINAKSTDGKIDQDELDRISKLITFAYHRIRKLDEERQYARYYSSALDKYKRTTATFNIWLDGEHCDLELSPLELTDLVVPDGSTQEVPKIDKAYRIEDILKKIQMKCSAT